jgi:ABC-type dipeptide/oligopeptide/nickel transport system permease component
MARYVLGRLVGVVGVLFAVSIMIFLMIHAIPGGPFDNVPETKQERPIPEHIRKALLAKYGLDQPLYVQYIRYMTNALKGDFGVSFYTGEQVSKFVARTWPVTIQLGLMALAISVPIGLGLGLLAAVKPNTWVDYLTSVLVVTTFVTPTFVIAIMAIIAFAGFLLGVGAHPNTGSCPFPSILLPRSVALPASRVPAWWRHCGLTTSAQLVPRD